MNLNSNLLSLSKFKKSSHISQLHIGHTFEIWSVKFHMYSIRVFSFLSNEHSVTKFFDLPAPGGGPPGPPWGGGPPGWGPGPLGWDPGPPGWGPGYGPGGPPAPPFLIIDCWSCLAWLYRGSLVIPLSSIWLMEFCNFCKSDWGGICGGIGDPDGGGPPTGPPGGPGCGARIIGDIWGPPGEGMPPGAGGVLAGPGGTGGPADGGGGPVGGGPAPTGGSVDAITNFFCFWQDSNSGLLKFWLSPANSKLPNNTKILCLFPYSLQIFLIKVKNGNCLKRRWNLVTLFKLRSFVLNDWLRLSDLR